MHHGCFLVVIVLPYCILSAKILVWRSFRRLCLAAAGPGEFFVCSWRPRWAEGHGGSASIKLLCSPASHCGCRRLRICSVVSSRNGYLDARDESSSTRCSCRVEKFIQTNYRLHGRPPTDESQSASTLCVSDCLSVYPTPSVCVCVCVCLSLCLIILYRCVPVRALLLPVNELGLSL